MGRENQVMIPCSFWSWQIRCRMSCLPTFANSTDGAFSVISISVQNKHGATLH